MKKIVVLSIVILGIVIYARPWSQGEAGPKFRTARIERGTIVSTVSATGTLNAVTTVQVGSQLSGIILKLHADFNSNVKEGQLLAELDPATFQASVDQANADVQAAEAAVKTATSDLKVQDAAVEAAKAELEASRANHRKAQVTLADRELMLKRTREIAAKKFASQQDLDTTLANRNTAQAEVESSRAAVEVASTKVHITAAQRTMGESKLDQSRAQLAQKKASLALSGVNLSRTKIYSPISGVVVSRNVDVGQTVAASFQAPVLFVIANDLRAMQIDANVDEADIGRVQVGQRVEFTVDAYPDDKFRGKVVQVRLQPIVSQNVVTYDTVVQVANDQLMLRPGMTANIYVQVARANDVLKVPNSALSFNPPADFTVPSKEKPRTQATASGREGGQERPSWQGRQGGREGGRDVAGEGSRDRGRAGRIRGVRTAARKGFRTIFRPSGRLAEPIEVPIGISDGSFTELNGNTFKENDVVIVGLESGESTGAAQQPAATNPFMPGPRRR